MPHKLQTDPVLEISVVFRPHPRHWRYRRPLRVQTIDAEIRPAKATRVLAHDAKAIVPAPLEYAA